MDKVKQDLEERHIQLSTAYGETKNREVWRNIIRASSSASCRKRKKTKKKKLNQNKIDRQQSKAREADDIFFQADGQTAMVDGVWS